MPTAGIKLEMSYQTSPPDWAEKLTGAALKAIPRALYRAGVPLQREMMSRAAVFTGNLRRSIGNYPGDDNMSSFVGVPGKDEIAQSNEVTVTDKATGKKRTVRQHSPAAAYAHVQERRTGFMAASLEAKKSEMGPAFEAELRRVIEGQGRRK